MASRQRRRCSAPEWQTNQARHVALEATTTLPAESRSHGYNAQRRKRPRQLRVCAEADCGESFETAIPHRLYCSRSCKKRVDNRRFRSGSGR